LGGTKDISTIALTPPTGPINYGGTTGLQGPSVAPTGGVNLMPSGNQAVVNPGGTQTTFNTLNGTNFINTFSTDLGIQVNALYAAMPSTGGVITIQVPPTGVSFTTPILFNIANKPVILDCLIDQIHNGTAMLKYMATTGTAITFNFNNGHNRGFGVKNCALLGNGGSSTGIFLGGTNGAEGVEISNSSIKGFATGMNFGDNTYLTLVKNVYFGPPSPGGVCLNDTDNNNTGEQMTFENVTFDSCEIGGVNIGGAGTQFNCDDCSFDDSQVVAGASQIAFKSPHFEDPGGTHFPFINMKGGNLFLLAPTFATDSTCTSSCPAAPIVQSAGNLTITGLTHFSRYGYSGFISLSGSSNFYELSPLQILGIANPSAPVVGTTTGLWIFDTGSELHWQSLLTNHMYSIQGPGIQSTTDTFARFGSYLEGANLQWRGMGTPDLKGFFNGKVKVTGTGFSGCLAYASALQFFTTNTSAVSSADLSRETGQFDCTGNLHVLGNVYVGNATAGTALPVVGTPTVGNAACIKAAGPPVVIGFCSTVVGASGSCTCN
jgi:hypothetical protein